MTVIHYIDVFRRTTAVICCIFGLPGNILTIIVCVKALCQRTINFKRKVFDLYLAEISILDTCLLLYWVIETLFHYLYSINQSPHFSLMHTSLFSCFFFYMINRLFAALCSWLITCYTFIRFLNMFQQLNTIRSNLILVTCLTIIFSVANSYLMITLNYDRGDQLLIFENSSTDLDDYSHNSTPCRIRDEYSNNPVTLLLNTLVAGFLNLVLPSMLTLAVNIATVCYIRRVYRTQKFQPITRHAENLEVNYRSTRSTLLVISITYTLCYIPYCIIYLLMVFGDVNSTLIYCSEIAFILRYISHSVNFYAYMFTSQRFRRDILAIPRYFCRPCTYARERSRQRKKEKRRQLLRQHYRLTPMVLPTDVPQKKLCDQQNSPTPEAKNIERKSPSVARTTCVPPPPVCHESVSQGSHPV